MAGARGALRAGLGASAWKCALERLGPAVQDDYPPAQRVLGVLARVWSAHVEPASRPALSDLADALLTAAAGREDRLAARVLASAPATSDSRTPNPTLVRAMIARLAESPPWEADFGRVAILSDRMRLIHAQRQLTSTECVYLTAKAEGRLQKSQVKSRDSARAKVADDRSSMDVGLPRTSHDPAVFWTVSRLCALAGRSWSCAESLNIIRYRPGEKFVSHFDADHTNADQIAQPGGLRRTTVLGYLCNGYQGGETAFPSLGVKIAPRAGDVIVFDNLDAEWRTEPASLHAGLPLIEGEKWILAQWFRRFPFDRAG